MATVLPLNFVIVLTLPSSHLSMESALNHKICDYLWGKVLQCHVPGCQRPWTWAGGHAEESERQMCMVQLRLVKYENTIINI